MTHRPPRPLHPTLSILAGVLAVFGSSRAQAQSMSASVGVTLTVLPVAILRAEAEPDSADPRRSRGALSWTISARHAHVEATATGLTMGDTVEVQSAGDPATSPTRAVPPVAVRLTGDHPTARLWVEMPLGVRTRVPVVVRCSSATRCPVITFTMRSSANGLGGEY
jgi:hypothetical protein